MRAIPLFAMLLVAGCSGGIGSDADVCIAQYGATAKSELGVRAAMHLCHAAHGAEATPARIQRAECALAKVRDAETDLAVRVVLNGCDRTG